MQHAVFYVCAGVWKHGIVKFTAICEPESGNKNLSVGWKFNDSGIGSISVIGTNWVVFGS